jgi:4-amino-4-deoxy-L-arabinose transferase-like glycosyltransferase
MPRWFNLKLIVALYLLLGAVYSVVTPVFEAPDESFHFFAMQYVRDERSLPVQGQSGAVQYEQEGSQPPLYYLAGALLTSWIDLRPEQSTTQLKDMLRQNPQANIGVPGDPGNKNRYIHTNQEDFPYRGAALAGHILRLGSLLLGLIVVLATYATARTLLPDRSAVAPLAAAAVAFTPQFIFISVAINNDNAINALAAVTLYLLARLLRGDRLWRTILLLALIVGLSTLAKLGGLILLGCAVCSIGYLGLTRRDRGWHWAAKAIGVMVVGAVLIGGWWYARNLSLYGDLTGLSAMYQIVGQRALTIGGLINELPGLWYSAWGIFGWFNIALPDWLYVFYSGLVLLAVLGGIKAGRQWLRQKQHHLSLEAEGLIGLSIYTLLVLIGVLRWTASTPGSQGRLIFPAAAALAILLAYGWRTLIPSARVWTGVMSTWIVIAALIPFAVIAPVYARPRMIALTDISADVKRLNVDFNGTLRLIGGKVETPIVQPGDLISVVLYWQALQKPDRDYMVFVHPLGRGLELVSKEDAYHGQGTFPTDLWRGDEIIEDRFTLRVKVDAQVPALVQVEAGLRDRATKQPVTITDAAGALQQGLLIVDDFVLRGAAPPAPQTAVRFRFGDQIELVGYAAPRVTPTGELAFRLYWRALQTPPGDYTVYALALDGQGQPIGQQDGPPFAGSYPTSRWLPGEINVEDRSIQLTGVAPSAVLLGLYRLSDQTRVPVVDNAGQRVPNDAIVMPVQP